MAWIDMFIRRNIPCFDGDGTCPKNSSPHGDRLRDCVQFGVSASAIEIIASAAPYYLGRHKRPARRLLAAFEDLTDVISANNSGSGFMVGRLFNEEWRKNLSEVLGVGLATRVICEYLPARKYEIRRIRKISGRRTCDFRVIQPGQITVYEARGRKNLRSALAATEELPEKKDTHWRAHYKYGLVAITGPAETLSVWVYDPPGEENLPVPGKESHLNMIAQYYRDAADAAGLSWLAESIEARMFEIEKAGKWIEGELPVSPKELGGNKRVLLGNDTFLGFVPPSGTMYLPTIESELIPGKPYKEPRKLKYDLRFALNSKTIEVIIKWNLEDLIASHIKAIEYPDASAYCGDDGVAIKAIRN